MGAISWSATRTGAPVAAASAYPMRTVICRGSAVPAAVKPIRAVACTLSRPCRGPVVSAVSSSSMSTPVTVGEHHEERGDPEPATADALARPWLGVCDPCRRHDSKTIRAGTKCRHRPGTRPSGERRTISSAGHQEQARLVRRFSHREELNPEASASRR